MRRYKSLSALNTMENYLLQPCELAAPENFQHVSIQKINKRAHKEVFVVWVVIALSLLAFWGFVLRMLLRVWLGM